MFLIPPRPVALLGRYVGNADQIGDGRCMEHSFTSSKVMSAELFR
jgi:hypothetical protein